MFRTSHMVINSTAQSCLCHCSVSKSVALPVPYQSISQNVDCASPNSQLLINRVTRFGHFGDSSISCGNLGKRREGGSEESGEV